MLHMPNCIRRGLAASLSICLAIPTVFAAVDDTKLQTTYEIADGLTYQNTISQSDGVRRESFSLTLSPDSDVFPISLQSSGTVYGASTIARAIEQAEARGYQVLGAINSDYFSTSTGIPLGMAVEDGIYLTSPGQFDALGFVDGRAQIITEPQVSQTLTNQATGVATNIPNFNKLRSASGGLYLLNENFSTYSTRTTGDGWIVRMEKVDDTPLTVNGTVNLVVTEVLETSEAVVIGENNYILTASSDAGYGDLYQSFSVGDQIALQTQCDDDTLVAAQWVTGVGDVMIADGSITNSADWEHTTDGKQPRTALGIFPDGSTIYYVTDGRKSGYSSGLSQLNLAKELLDLGCTWAVNLDGGGSSVLAATLPGNDGATVQNSPSDGKPRAAATFILLVTDQAGSNQPKRLALQSDGSAVLSGTSLSLDNIVAVDEYGTTIPANLGNIIFSKADLGAVNGNIYTAGSVPGTDTITFTSSALGISGTAQIHVVDALTQLNLTREGQTNAISTLSLKVGDSVQLVADGEYWGRTALRSTQGISWTLNDLATVDSNGLLTALGGEGTITATAGSLSADIKLTVANVHNDVTPDHWSYKAVDYCYENGIMNGVSTTEFGLGRQIKRGDFVLTLYKALGQPSVNSYTPFSDVNSTDYYAAAISWAAENGIANGLGNGSFGAQSSITREQAFTILGRALPLMNIDVADGKLSVLQYFTDNTQVADYAKQPLATLVTHRLVAGSNGLIRPTGSLTREEMATLMERFLTYNPDVITPLEPPVVAPTDLTLNRNDLVLLHHEVVTLEATLSPVDSSGTVIWSSSDPSIATVDQNGAVTNVFEGIGQPAVTITARCGNLFDTATVRCRPLGDEGEDLGGDDDFDITFPTVAPDKKPEVEPPTPDVEIPTNAPKGTVIDAPAGLNLRGGPGSSFTVIGLLAEGTTVSILNTLDGWYQVVAVDTTGKTVTGYASSTYVQLTATTPEVTPPEVTKPEVTTPEITTQPAAPYGTVIDAPGGLNIRATASATGTPLSRLENGTTVTILDSIDGWHKVNATDVNGAIISGGYVSANYIALPTPYEVVEATTLNVRSGAGSTFEILDTLALGDTLYLVSSQDGWCQVKYEKDGALRQGYVSANYILPQ